MGFPVTFAQQLFWFCEQLAPGQRTYNVPPVFYLHAPLVARALRRASDATVPRHAPLSPGLVVWPGAPAPLRPLLMDYGDSAVWQRDRMQGEELDRQLSYWREQLRGAPRLLTLPAGRPRPARRSTRGGMATMYVDAATTQRLADAAH